MDPHWVWFLFFLGAALIFFVLEVLIPSAGILGTLALLSLGGAIIMLFSMNTTYGMIGVVAALFIIPAALVLALKVFPHTPIGRRLILKPPPDLNDPVHFTSTGEDNYDNLLNARGRVISTLRPVGIVRFGDRKVECLAERGPIEPDTEVKVISVHGFEVKVRTV